MSTNIEKIDTGTYVRIKAISPTDSFFKVEQNYKDNVYVVGNIEDKFPRTYLSSIDGVDENGLNLYSGPITDVKTGVTSWISSMSVEVLETSIPTADLVATGTEILILDVPFLDRLVGKTAFVGIGGLNRTPEFGPNNYSGLIELKNSAGNTVEFLNLGNLKFVLAKSLKEPQANIRQQDYKKSETDNGVKKDESIMKIENPTERYKITEVVGNVYFEFSRLKGGFNFGDPEISKAASIDTWGSWRPEVGMEGTLVWKGKNDDVGHELYVLKLDLPDGKHQLIIMNPVGLSKVEAKVEVKSTTFETFEKEQKEELKKYSLAIEEKLKILKTKEQALKKIAEDEKSKANVASKDKTDDAVQQGSGSPKPVLPGSAEATVNGSSDKAALASAAVVVIDAVNNIETSELGSEDPTKGKGFIMSKVTEALNTAKSDGKKVGVRVAARQARKVLMNPIMAFINAKFANAPETQQAIVTAINSKEGQAIVDIVLGAGLTQLPLPKGAKHSEYISKIAEEFRVSGGTELGDTIADMFTGPLIQLAEIYASMAGASDEEVEKPAVASLPQNNVAKVVDVVVEQPEVVSRSR